MSPVQRDDRVEWHNEAYAEAAQELFESVETAIREQPESRIARSPLIQGLLAELKEEREDHK